MNFYQLGNYWSFTKYSVEIPFVWSLVFYLFYLCVLRAQLMTYYQFLQTVSRVIKEGSI